MAEASQKMPAKSEEKGREPAPAEWSPLATMRREFDRMLDEFPWGWRRPLARGLFDVEPFFRGFAGVGAIPAVDIAEKDKEYEITAELPGMDESNIDVKFADGLLTIKGEKREEKEEKKKDYYLSERRYGSFQRSFPVPESVDTDKIEAKFANGVLTVRLPKSAEAQKNEKKIAIKKGQERGIELTFLGTRGEIKIRSRRHFRQSALLVRDGHARMMIDCGVD